MVPVFLFKYTVTIAKKIKCHLSIVVLQYTLIKFLKGGFFLITIFNFRLKHTKNYLNSSKELITFLIIDRFHFYGVGNSDTIILTSSY